jgi:hypothetical protein
MKRAKSAVDRIIIMNVFIFYAIDKCKDDEKKKKRSSLLSLLKLWEFSDDNQRSETTCLYERSLSQLCVVVVVVMAVG